MALWHRSDMLPARVNENLDVPYENPGGRPCVDHPQHRKYYRKPPSNQSVTMPPSTREVNHWKNGNESLYIGSTCTLIKHSLREK